MSDQLPSHDPDATLRPPQFTLRTLMAVTLAVAVLVSVMMAVGKLWAVGLLFLVLLISAHVIGNAVGTRLRDRAITRPEVAAQLTRQQSTVSAAAQFSPSRLGEHRRLHWFTLVLTLSGGLMSGYFGGKALAISYPDATTAAVWLAHISSGVLGALAVFVVTAFLAVLRQMLSEAHAGSDHYHPAGFREAKPVGPIQRPGEE